MGTINIGNRIMAKPVVQEGLKTEQRGGIISVKQQTDIVALEVVFKSEAVSERTKEELSLEAGDSIYVEEMFLFSEPWGKKIMTIDGVKVIMVPAERIVAIKVK